MNIEELIKKTAGVPVDLTEQGEASIAGRLQKNYDALSSIFNSAKRLKSFNPQFAQKIEEFHELFEKSVTNDGKAAPKGKGAQYIEKGNELKFGMLKALYHDAIAYKKKREYKKGVAKFALRAIPLAMAPIFFPAGRHHLPVLS